MCVRGFNDFNPGPNRGRMHARKDHGVELCLCQMRSSQTVYQLVVLSVKFLSGSIESLRYIEHPISRGLFSVSVLVRNGPKRRRPIPARAACG